jgi:hypothetical protein
MAVFRWLRKVFSIFRRVTQLEEDQKVLIGKIAEQQECIQGILANRDNQLQLAYQNGNWLDPEGMRNCPICWQQQRPIAVRLQQRQLYPNWEQYCPACSYKLDVTSEVFARMRVKRNAPCANMSEAEKVSKLV